jgi:outer membrane protein TolC
MSIRCIWFLAFLILLGGPAEVPGQEPGPAADESLTLEQAIALATGANRQLKNSAIEIDKFADREAAARTRRLPEFKFSVLGGQLISPLEFRFDQGAFGNYPGIGPIPNQDTIVRTPRQPTALIIGQINQPLSQLYRIGLNLKQIGIGREIAEQQVRSQRHAIVNRVRHAYYAILQTQSALRASEEAVKLYQELDRLTENYVVQRVAMKAEGLEVKTKLARSEYEALAMRDQLASQKEQLNQLLGRDIRTGYKVSAAPEFSQYEVDLAGARERALKQRPEVQEARLKVRQGEYDRRLKKSEYIPDVSLTFNYISPNNINFVPRQVASVGVLVSWEPFDWGRKKRELAEKKRSVEQAENSLLDAETQVLIEVNGKYRQLQQSRQLLLIGHLAEETARESLRVLSNRYSMQAALLKDVLSAQNSHGQGGFSESDRRRPMRPLNERTASNHGRMPAGGSGGRFPSRYESRSQLMILVLCSLALAISGCRAQGAAAEPAPVSVKVKAVELNSVSGGVRYAASIEPRKQIELAFKVGGYVDHVLQVRGVDGRMRDVQEGDIVTKGAILARVRQSDYAVKVSQAESQFSEAESALESSKAQFAEARSAVTSSQSQLAEAEAALKKARLDFDRAGNLFSTHSLTKTDFDAAESQFKIAEAKRNAALSQVGMLEAKASAAGSQIEMTRARVKGAQSLIG